MDCLWVPNFFLYDLEQVFAQISMASNHSVAMTIRLSFNVLSSSYFSESFSIFLPEDRVERVAHGDTTPLPGPYLVENEVAWPWQLRP